MNRLTAQVLLAAALVVGSGSASAQSSSESAGTARWSHASAASLARQEIYPAVLNGKIYVAGGVLTPPTNYSAHFEAYDAHADRWFELMPIPEARHHIGLAEAGGLIYGVGGFTGGFPFWRAQSSVFVYDPRTNQWSTAPSLPEARAEGVVVSANDKIFVIGGRVASKPGATHFNDHSDTVRGSVLDPATGRWSPIADAPTARNSAAAGVIGGKIYVVGGRQALKQPDGSLRQVNVATLEVYDPGSDRWQSKTPMPQAQGGLAAAVHEGRLYAFGGEQWFPDHQVFAECWVYEPSSDSWTAVPSLPTPRHGLGAAAIGNRIFVMGGGARVGGAEATDVNEVLEFSFR